MNLQKYNEFIEKYNVSEEDDLFIPITFVTTAQRNGISVEELLEQAIENNQLGESLADNVKMSGVSARKSMNEESSWRGLKMKHKQIEVGEENFRRIKKFFQQNLCATQRECADALNLSVMTVNRHTKKIREEWKNG